MHPSLYFFIPVVALMGHRILAFKCIERNGNRKSAFQELLPDLFRSKSDRGKTIAIAKRIAAALATAPRAL